MTAAIIRNPLFKAGHIYEVRIPGTPQGTISGYFDNEASLIAAVTPWTATWKPSTWRWIRSARNCLRRAQSPRHESHGHDSRSRHSEPRVAPHRPGCDTSQEHVYDRGRAPSLLREANMIKEWLTEQKWPEPLVCDSGNGTHLLYAIDLPNTAASTQTIKAILKGLAERFDDAMVKVDTSVHNASRITKLYGTMACKGENTPDRPHRRSAILSQPVLEAPTVVTSTQLEALVAQTTQTKAATQTTPGTSLDVPAFLMRHQLEVTQRETLGRWRHPFWTRACPFEPSHELHSFYYAICQWGHGVPLFAFLVWRPRLDRAAGSSQREAAANGPHRAPRPIHWGNHGQVALVPRRPRCRDHPGADWRGGAAHGRREKYAEGCGCGASRQTKRDAMRVRVGTRLSMPYHPEDIAVMAEKVERATLARATDFELLSYAGILMRVVVEPLPQAHEANGERTPVPTAHLDPLTRTKLLPLVERAVVFKMGGAIGVPAKILDHLLVIPPAFLRSALSWRIRWSRVAVASSLLQGLIGRRACCCTARRWTSCAPIHRRRRGSGGGFGQVVSRRLRARHRSWSSLCPWNAANGGGAQDAARVPRFSDHRCAAIGGEDHPRRRTHIVPHGARCAGLDVAGWQRWNRNNKLLLSTLLRCPPLICFDNVGDGLTFRSPALAAAMTSATKEGAFSASVKTRWCRPTCCSSSQEIIRILRTMRCGAGCVCGSPRATSIPINAPLPTRTCTITRLPFVEVVLRHCVGIVAGYRQGSERIPRRSRFVAWDGLVRQPLLWAGVEEDIGTAFDANIEASPELGAHLALLTELYQEFPTKALQREQVIETYNHHAVFHLHPLKECMSRSDILPEITS